MLSPLTSISFVRVLILSVLLTSALAYYQVEAQATATQGPRAAVSLEAEDALFWEGPSVFRIGMEAPRASFACRSPRPTGNPGVLIATSPQTAVQAVFEGEVVKVDAMPDLGTILLLRHGAYLTLYGNVSMLYVGQGDHVEAGQTLGRAGTDGEPRGAGLFFALFKEGQAVDPAAWLRPR